jgi:hypothetical protein
VGEPSRSLASGHRGSPGGHDGGIFHPYLGRAFVGDGVGTAVASFVGGSPTTTYAENIGVMAATRIYSTAAYYVAAIVALLLGFCPKFGAVISATPGGVLGGITLVLYGMIGLLGTIIALVGYHVVRWLAPPHLREEPQAAGRAYEGGAMISTGKVETPEGEISPFHVDEGGPRRE